MVTPMFEPRVRPRYPLDDSWLFADPMNLALEGEPPVRDAPWQENPRDTRACAARNLEESLGAGVSEANRPCFAIVSTSAFRVCAFVIFAGVIWLFFGTGTRWRGAEVTPAAASIAAVNCPQGSGSSDALRTL